ncbi:HNH endonuclease [Micromonospora azadirachtae]|uniref:HNH endonuclease n=1 Tax=Micromonospora azadirachtae TaxID=1970735 RepID=A0ABW2ZWG5_9ACTN
MQIDHIIPESISTARLQELKDIGTVDPDFDLHRPRNLAPACRPCNRDKSNGDFLDHPKVLGRLRRALKFEPDIDRLVRSFFTANKIAKSMLTIRSADPTDRAAAAAFVQHGPAIVQVIAQINPAMADYRTTAVVRGAYGETHLLLNSRGRTAVTIIEELCLTPMSEAVEHLVDTLISKIDDQVRYSLAQDDSDDVGPASIEFLDLEITSFDFEGTGAVSVVAQGTFDVTFSAMVVQNNQWGDGLVDRQGDGDASGRLWVELSWNPGAVGTPSDVHAEIHDWNPRVWRT